MVAAVSVVVDATARWRALPTFVAHGSVNQVYVTKLVPGDAVTLRDASSSVVATGTADSQGAFLFRTVPRRHGLHGEPGRRHLGAADGHDPDRQPARQRPTRASRCTQGFNYIPTRDGTLLSANITFPSDGSPGPWPVLLDYSGYDPSQPGQPPSEAAMFPLPGLRRRRA